MKVVGSTAVCIYVTVILFIIYLIATVFTVRCFGNETGRK
jgi:hypothetical protein